MTDFREYKFSIIYSVDVPRDVRLAGYRPPLFQKLKWDVTETGESEIGSGEPESIWGRGSRHRKYCNVLNFEEFCEFLQQLGLNPERCQTMGSIGAPGFGFGWAPAVAFRADDPDALQGAYVTLVPPEIWKGEEDTQPNLPGLPDDIRALDFESIEREMWEVFDGCGWEAVDMMEELATEAA